MTVSEPIETALEPPKRPTEDAEKGELITPENDRERGPEGELFKSNSFCNLPGGSRVRRAKGNTLRPDLRPRLIELLIGGANPSKAAEILGSYPSQASYHIDCAVKAGEIVRVPDSWPHRYIKGPRYGEALYKYRGWRRSRLFEHPLCRITPGNGSAFRVKVLKEGDLSELRLPAERLPLFPKNPVGKKGEKHYNASLPVPAAIVGREGGTASLVFFPAPRASQGGGLLTIDPPELRLDQRQLIASPGGPELFRSIYDHVLDLLTRNGGWRFGEIVHQEREVHYAFARSAVDPLLPGLTSSPEVHGLRRGDNEADHPLFLDLSEAAGPGGELETIDLRMAQDLLAILTEAFREQTRPR